MSILNYIEKIVLASINILNGASVWLVISFILAGLLHDILAPDKFQKMLGNKKISSLIKSTISGMLLPICSCGVIPLGLSMYYSGAYLGPTLAFMVATPIINPIAVILCFGLLGPEISIIYLTTGFVVPIIIGIIGNTFGGSELKAPGVEENIQAYLGNPSAISLIFITLLATVMYVCAVGHIPFVAALIASGAAPGIAITFLMAGAATNLPELISIYKIIGKRTVIIYSSVIVTTSVLVGYITNLILMPNFKPAMNFDRVDNSISAANKIIFVAPEWLKYLCSFIIFLFCIRAISPNIKNFFASKEA
ncbi:permease [Clostridium sp. FP1]|uniref:permease n=1 Tax=Clostridium sp. FP1 TaxID=2724076 RepID=UPI0013E9366D|nr:permease [Clostridium sp. FP1]MBZ9633769.1 permease [Clostridium sp. FP1]